MYIFARIYGIQTVYPCEFFKWDKLCVDDHQSVYI